jgi:8-oxo-dGTP diphosphatase
VIQVTAAVIVRHGKVFIARRRPAARLGGMWEFPGGKIEPGETAEACLKRELKEEFDIEATVGEALGCHVHRYDFGTVALTAFRVDEIDGRMRLNDHSAARWVTAGQLGDFDFAPADLPFVAMIRSGRIRLRKT